MKLFWKHTKRIVITLIVLLLVGFAVYRFAYPYVAPILFDYLVDRNADMFVKLEEALEANLDTAPADFQEPALVPEEPPLEETPEIVSLEATPKTHNCSQKT